MSARALPVKLTCGQPAQHLKELTPHAERLTIYSYAVNPELAGLMRRLKTIYAITGGQIEGNGKQKDDFNTKKSVLIAQLHNFDKLIEARDKSGLSTDSRDYIRLKNQIAGELGKLEVAVKDLAETHKKEVSKRG